MQVKKTITGFNEPRQAITYSQESDKAYVLNKDLSISIINYNTGIIIENISK